jgi:hypothetical protein
MNFLMPLMVGGPDMANKKGSPRGFRLRYNNTFNNNNNTFNNIYKKELTSEVKSYLAGLFEGNGHIWIQDIAFSKKKQHNPRFCITFHMKNEPLAEKLKELIGSGSIRYKLQDSACNLVISPVRGLKRVVNLLNGELRTPKIRQLYSLIDWLNKNHNLNIIKLPLKKDYLYKDSWLSGFIDSDGSFSVQHTKVENGAKKRKISCRLRIEERILDPVTKDSNMKVLRDISNFLDCTLLTREQKSTGNRYYTLTASKKISLKIIINYLDKYPLLSSKNLDYKDWKEIVLLMFENKHYTEKGISKTELVRSCMNTKRTHFSWDHLLNL